MKTSHCVVLVLVVVGAAGLTPFVWPSSDAEPESVTYRGREDLESWRRRLAQGGAATIETGQAEASTRHPAAAGNAPEPSVIRTAPQLSEAEHEELDRFQMRAIEKRMRDVLAARAALEKDPNSASKHLRHERAFLKLSVATQVGRLISSREYFVLVTWDDLPKRIPGVRVVQMSTPLGADRARRRLAFLIENDRYPHGTATRINSLLQRLKIESRDEFNHLPLAERKRRIQLVDREKVEWPKIQKELQEGNCSEARLKEVDRIAREFTAAELPDGLIVDRDNWLLRLPLRR